MHTFAIIIKSFFSTVLSLNIDSVKYFYNSINAQLSNNGHIGLKTFANSLLDPSDISCLSIEFCIKFEIKETLK